MSEVVGKGTGSRRAVAKMLVGAAAVGVAGKAQAQYASGSGRYVPYNCSETSQVNTLPLPILNYTCNPVSDISLVTLMLNLEYLEASFYLYATTGAGLPASDQGGQAVSVSGGRKASLSNPTVVAYAQQLAADERNHVEPCVRPSSA